MEDNTSSDVETPNLDYKRTNNIYIYIATMRMIVIGFAFHPICILNSNKLWALCLPESVPSVPICVYLCSSMPFICAIHILITKQKKGL